MLKSTRLHWRAGDDIPWRNAQFFSAPIRLKLATLPPAASVSTGRTPLHEREGEAKRAAPAQKLQTDIARRERDIGTQGRRCMGEFAAATDGHCRRARQLKLGLSLRGAMSKKAVIPTADGRALQRSPPDCTGCIGC